MLNKLNILKREGDSKNPLFFLSFKNVSLKFNQSDEPLFKDLSFELGYSNIIVLKGRVGSGKTSILKLLGGIFETTSGEINHIDKSGKKLEPVYVHSLSEFNFVTGYVKDEIALSDIDESVIDPQFIDRSIYDLSGGELKRLSIMIAVADKKRSVVLLDEPLDMLDDDWCEKIVDQIVESSKCRAFIIATHDHNFDKYADYVIEIL